MAAHHALVKAIGNAGQGEEDRSALAASEPPLFNNNEVELLSDSLMNNDGVLRGYNVIKYVPDQSALKLSIGDRISLAAADAERLSAAFLAGIERTLV